MTFRARMSLAFIVAALVPLAVLTQGVRRDVTRRLAAQHERRVGTLVGIVRQDLARESASIEARLEVLETDLAGDDRFRLGAVHGDPAQRRYVLDWAGRAMEIAGLSVLRVYDDAATIVSSGHFRNEFGGRDSALFAHLAAAPNEPLLVRVKTPTGSFLALVRSRATRVAGRQFMVVGGTTVDSAFFDRLGRDGELDVALALGALESPQSRSLERLPLFYVDDTARALAPAHLSIAARGNEMQALRRDIDRWAGASFLFAAIAALVLVAWLAASLSRPMATLARAALSIDFHTPEVDAVAARDDEIGTLARRFSAMTRRLRTNGIRLRDAERRATVGEMARQLNHDMKNGLVPIRNVLRHLSQVQERAPHELATVFGERRATLESSVSYLDDLAVRWTRLAPRSERTTVDVNGIVRDIATTARDAYGATVRLALANEPAMVAGDPLALRRVVDNLVINALQSLDGEAQGVTVSTERRDHTVRLAVADTGRGMSQDELSRALGGFYTTKPHGTGLGLSVVRRLVADHGGMMRIDSAPRRGTTVLIELPLHSSPHRS